MNMNQMISKDATASITIIAKLGAPAGVWMAGSLRAPGSVLTVPRMQALDLVRRGRATLNP